MQKKAKNERPPALAGWDDDGGAAPSDRGRVAEAERQDSVERSGRRAAFDASHDSSARGEHRYPDAHQTESEQKARDDRDHLKRKLEGTR